MCLGIRLPKDFFFGSTSVQFNHSVMSNSLRPHGLQHSRLPCLLPTPRACSDLGPSSWWCHPLVSFSVFLFSSRLQSFPASVFSNESGGQCTGVSASTSVLPMNIQDLSPFGLTGWISFAVQGHSGVFFNTTVQKHQFFGAQLSIWSSCHIHTWLLEKL